MLLATPRVDVAVFHCPGAAKAFKTLPGFKKRSHRAEKHLGTIVVESWNKDEIRLTATIESKHALVVPRQIDQNLVVDVMSDNRGKGDVGDINFKLQVPVDSSVDLETRRGNIYVANIRSGLVRAHVSSEGDIELTNITASHVIAQNVIGNIFFDGQFSRGGTYEFKSKRVTSRSGFPEIPIFVWSLLRRHARSR